MARDAGKIVWASAYAAIGVLWMALIGACTWNEAMTDREFGSLWPLGVVFMSGGLVPLAVGLHTFLPVRAFGWGLVLVGAGWLVWGVTLIAGPFLNEGIKSASQIVEAALAWTIFDVPGLLMLGVGISILRSAAKLRAGVTGRNG